jgi:transcriptional regulator with XRE-family HTH domain
MSNPREGMRRRRQQLGYTQEALAEALGVATNTYREWERGIATPRVGFRPRLAKRLEVSCVEVDRWLDGDGRSIAPNGLDVPAWLGHYASLEQGAGELWTFEPFVVPGLLQTAAYAASVEQRGPGSVSDVAVAEKVRVRLARQAVLSRQPDPLVLSAIIDESVLYRRAGDDRVMADQLSALAVAADQAKVVVQVLPFDAGDFSAAFGSFTVLTSPGSSEPYIACTRDRAGPHYLDRTPEVEAHIALFRHLTDVALSPGDSRALICAVTKERYQ